MQLLQLAQVLEAQIVGDPTHNFESIAPLAGARSQDLTFVLEQKFVTKALETQAGALITFRHISELSIPQLIVKNPKKALKQTLETFFPEYTSFTPGTLGCSPLAVIDPTAVLGVGVIVGPFCVIGKNAVVGAHTQLVSHVVIGEGVRVGAGCKFHSHVTIYDRVKIGDKVILHAGSVVGRDGFGYSFEAGAWKHIPQIGSVIVGDDVELGVNSAIDRACLGNTQIGNGVKIDNLVQVGHNVVIGDHSIIAGQAGISGSATLEDHVVVGGGAGLSGVFVGAGAQIAGRSGVTKDVASGAIVSGFPAQDHRKELKKEAFIRKLVQ